MTDPSLFDEYDLNSLHLKNRLVMAPMTRSRADADGVPSPLAILYYAQRSTAGLIITEGVQPSPSGQGYARTPGIHSDQQIKRWQEIAEAVHANDSRIFMQLMHAGRVAHPLNKQPGARTVAPSAINAHLQIHTDQEGLQPTVTPEALSETAVGEVLQEYRLATRNALAAGMDGVELHAGSGYLPMQFLSPDANRRMDRFGGSPANRCRFVFEALEHIAGVSGPGRVGIKIAPGITFNNVRDPEPRTTYSFLLTEIDKMGLAYVNLQRPARFLAEVSQGTDYDSDWLRFVRDHFSGTIISGGDYDGESADADIRSGKADLIAFGRSFLANPDLPKKLQSNEELIRPDFDKLYTPGAAGYIDYPTSYQPVGVDAQLEEG